MTVVDADPRNQTARGAERVPIVSIDSHVAPEVTEYVPYCEAKYRDDLDQFIAEIDKHMVQATQAVGQASSPRRDRYMAKMAEFGTQELNSDPKVRLEHMDADGIAVDTVYHGGFNFQPIPFFGQGLTDTFSQDIPAPGKARELRAAGIRMYNRWLADWVSFAPERFVGVAHLPIWDVDAAIAEVKAARESGLKGVNLPSPRREITTYNDPAWYPFWEACLEAGFALHNHGGAGDVFPVTGAGAFSLRQIETPMAARRAIGQMIFGQVFEKYPDLKLILTEQMGTWVPETLAEFDSAYHSSMAHREVPYIQDVLPRLPSEYFRDNVFVGASFMSRPEAEMAVEKGYWENMIWGRDFPHPEGCWPHTLLSLRRTFAGLPLEAVQGMVGGNAIRALGLDPASTQAIADRVGLRLDQIDDPLDEVPEEVYPSLGFRTIGTWA